MILSAWYFIWHLTYDYLPVWGKRNPCQASIQVTIQVPTGKYRYMYQVCIFAKAKFFKFHHHFTEGGADMSLWINHSQSNMKLMLLTFEGWQRCWKALIFCTRNKSIAPPQKKGAKGRMTGTTQTGKTESNMDMDDRLRTKGILPFYIYRISIILVSKQLATCLLISSK